MKTNWKTTIGGLLAAIGSFLSSSQTGNLQGIGQVIQVTGLFLLGVVAQDASINSK